MSKHEDERNTFRYGSATADADSVIVIEPEDVVTEDELAEADKATRPDFAFGSGRADADEADADEADADEADAVEADAVRADAVRADEGEADLGEADRADSAWSLGAIRPMTEVGPGGAAVEPPLLAETPDDPMSAVDTEKADEPEPPDGMASELAFTPADASAETAAGTAAEAPADAAAEAGVRGDAVVAAEAPASAAGDERWHEVLSRFVDDPRGSVEAAAALIDNDIATYIARLGERQDAMLAAWQGDEDSDTENLRIALKGYRDFRQQLADGERTLVS